MKEYVYYIRFISFDICLQDILDILINQETIKKFIMN
jgi:hypothetical protein